MNLFGELKRPGFWVGVIVVVIGLRWLERTVPAVRMVTSPGANGA